MYFLNLIGLSAFIWFQIRCFAPYPSHSLQKDLRNEIPSGSQLLFTSYFNQDSGKYCAISLFTPHEYLYYDKYFVSVITTTVEHQMTTIDTITHQPVTIDTIFNRIEGYDLINLEKRKYTRYTLFSKSAVKSKEGVIERRVNLDDFNDYSLAMSVVKDLNDTLIDKRNFKRVWLKSDTSVAHFIAYFDPIKVESPLQLSKILGAKYNATLVKFELLHPSGERVAIEMKYKPGSLTKEQKEVIAQWIKNENK